MIKKRVFFVFLVISGIALIQIITTIILARMLPKPDMGLYKLVITIGEFVAIFAILGLHGSFLRFFSRQPAADYNWKRYGIIAIVCCTLLSTLLIIGAGIFYSLKIIFVLIAVVISIAALVNMLFTSILRAERKYELAIFFARVNFLIFFAFLIMLFIFKKINLGNALGLFLFSALISTLLIIIITFIKVPSGKRPIPFRVFKQGLIFFGIVMASITMLKADQLFIAKMLSYQDLATYTVILSTMRVFEFSTDAIHYVLVPYLAKIQTIKPQRIIFALALIALTIALFYLLLGRPLIHILFAGKYDEGIKLLPFFIGAGVFKIMFVLPASIAGARANTKILKRFFYFCCAIVLVSLSLNYLFITRWGLSGAALSRLLSWAITAIGAFLVVKESHCGEKVKC